jgi:hypothetical protein
LTIKNGYREGENDEYDEYDECDEYDGSNEV